MPLRTFEEVFVELDSRRSSTDTLLRAREGSARARLSNSYNVSVEDKRTFRVVYDALECGDIDLGWTAFYGAGRFAQNRIRDAVGLPIFSNARRCLPVPPGGRVIFPRTTEGVDAAKAWLDEAFDDESRAVMAQGLDCAIFAHAHRWAELGDVGQALKFIEFASDDTARTLMRDGLNTVLRENIRYAEGWDRRDLAQAWLVALTDDTRSSVQQDLVFMTSVAAQTIDPRPLRASATSQGLLPKLPEVRRSPRATALLGCMSKKGRAKLAAATDVVLLEVDHMLGEVTRTSDIVRGTSLILHKHNCYPSREIAISTIVALALLVDSARDTLSQGVAVDI